jgi:hypothetical protein
MSFIQLLFLLFPVLFLVFKVNWAELQIRKVIVFSLAWAYNMPKAARSDFQYYT